MLIFEGIFSQRIFAIAFLNEKILENISLIEKGELPSDDFQIQENVSKLSA